MALPSWPAFDSSSTYARSMTPIRLCAEPTAPSAKTKAKPNSVATTIRLFNPSASRLRVQRCSRGVPRHSLSVHHRLGLPCFLLLYGRKCKKRLPKEALPRSEEHTSELQSREKLVCRLLLEKKKNRAH